MTYIHDISEQKHFFFADIPIHNIEDPTFRDKGVLTIGNLVEVEIEKEALIEDLQQLEDKHPLVLLY